MPPRRRLLADWKWWIAAWGVAVVGLVLFLPAGPAVRVPMPGLMQRIGSADDRTLVLCRLHSTLHRGVFSGPIHVVEIPGGAVRRIDLPDDLLAQRPDDIPDEELVEIEEREWVLQYGSISSDFLVTWMTRGGEGRLHAWNWRTGQEVLSHATTGFIGRLLGSRIWLQPAGGRVEETTRTFAYLDLRSGQRVETELPAEAINLLNVVRSPNGAFVVPLAPRNRDGGEIQVWNLERSVREKRQELYRLPDVERCAFSSDSRRLATISRWTRLNDTQHHRLWRVHDAESGAELQRHEEVRTARSYELPDAETLVVHDEANCIVASGRYGSVLIPERWEIGTGVVQKLEQSRYQTRSVGQVGEYGDVTMSRYVYDRPLVLDVTTGQSVAGLDADFDVTAVSPGARWAVVDDERPRMRDRIWDFIQTQWYGPGMRILSPSPQRLYDLSQRRSLAFLGFGDEETESIFTPDGRWLVWLTRDGLEIWSLPPERPLVRALLWSLLVPLTAAVWMRLRRPFAR